MDINAAYARLSDAIQAVKDVAGSSDLLASAAVALELGDAWDALDTWMWAGGHRPTEWIL